MRDTELTLAHKINGFCTSSKIIAHRSALNILRHPVLLRVRFVNLSKFCALIYILNII